MNANILEEKRSKLNERLRILILQNARESSFDGDERFLKEIRELADRILQLNGILRGNKTNIPDFFSRTPVRI